MLTQVAEYNDLSPALLQKLNEKIKSFGKVVKYRFDIEQENPDKTFYNGKTIFPGIYTLDPAVFNITDNDEKRDGKTKFKKIALIKSHESNGTGGFKTQFIKVRVHATARGILRLDLEKPEDVAMCMFMELHPKLKGGLFYDKERVAVFSRIDDVIDAKQKIAERSERKKALDAVEGMSAVELINFADAMGWDSTQEIDVLKNMAEEQAELEPKLLNDVIGSDTYKIRAIIKQALDREIITYDPATFKFSWSGTTQPITVVNPTEGQTSVVKFAEFLHTGGDKAGEVLKKITQLVKEAKKQVA